eukprot:gb/GECG01016835.1/.p1 GENE.gb/GECG01016835.1/~~gb/GECG01016835.1/.p1  ORF type:complete len:301 (+),score=57.74 gb/GECG01016835.1/:1-903(+)
MDLKRVEEHCTATGSGRTLNVEERAGLETAMAERRLDERLVDIKFWGKIDGLEKDYLIVYGLKRSQEHPQKQLYFCTTGNFQLQQLPELDEEYRNKAKAIKGPFKGDPTDLYGEEEEEEEGEEGEEEEEDEEKPLESKYPDSDDEDEENKQKQKKPKFSEMHRLSYVVGAIDYSTAVVPRGAYIVTATHHIVENTSFQGLTLSEAESLGNYYHFRYPENTKRKSILEKRGMVESTDFLDPLSEDTPNGVWCLQTNLNRGHAVLRSLEYPGYFFFHTIGTKDYGGAYFGDGQPNKDLPFMI